MSGSTHGGRAVASGGRRAAPWQAAARLVGRLNQPILLAAGFLVLSLVVGVATWLVASVRAQNEVLLHTLSVENQIALVLLDMRRAESAQRGFLLTGNEDYRRLYEEARDRVPDLVERLRTLIADNPTQARAATTVARLAADRLDNLERVLRLREAGETDAALADVRSIEGQKVMESLRAVAEAMSAEERRLFAIRSAAVDSSSQALLVSMAGGFLLVVLLAALSVFLVRRSNRERDQALGELEATNERLEETVAERTADLQEANTEIQRFAYIVSHDLRSPLVNIMGFTSELEVFREQTFAEMEKLRAAAGHAAAASTEALRADFDEALAFIKASIGKMDRLINAILRLSREGRRQFHPEPVDMTALIGGIVETVAHQAAERQAEIFVGDLPPLTADRLAVEQVFSNLIDNALKYLRDGVPGLIEVKGRATLTHATYEVADNGRGIDPRDHLRIFDLFRRAGEQDRPGEGMGLAHARALVRRMGGTLNVRSEPGKGSTFTVMLPLRPRRTSERSEGA